MVYVNLSYIQCWQFVDVNNTLDTKGHSTVKMIKELRYTFVPVL